MKTNPSLRIFKLALLVASGLVMAHPALATINELIITENSPTDLSATYNGSPLTVLPPVGQLAFSVLAPAGVKFDLFNPLTSTEQLAFIEPEDPTLINFVTASDNLMGILSDFPSSSLDSHQVSKTLFVSDGTRVNPAGFDLNTFTGIALTFHDNAESTESVPDRGSTFGLLFFSLTALVGLNRLRHVQLA